MTVLWFNLGLVYFLSTLSRFYSKPKLSPTGVKPNVFLVVVITGIMVMVAGLQYNIGDTSFYMRTYTLHQFTWEDIQSGKDAGFILLQMLMQRYTEDPQMMILFTALLTNILIVTTFYKYSRMFEISLFVYIASGLFLVSMNGIRQFLASAIVFAAMKYLIEGNWKKYFLIVLLASTIHQSALIMIPIYFVVRRNAWTWTSLLFIVSAIFIVIGYNQFSSVLFSAIENTQYGRYKDFTEGGANFLRVVVYAVPLLLAYFGREKLRSICPYSDYIVNFSLIALILMIISTQNWIFARMTIYFSVYYVVLVSWICMVFAKKDRKLVYYGIAICFLIFFYYEHVVSLNIDYRSDYLRW